VPIKTLQTRLPRLGRVSLGYRTKSSKGKTIPAKSKTIVFSAPSRERLEQLAGIYGGEVREAVEPGPDGAELFVLVSTSTELAVIVPADADELVFAEWLELHGSGGLRRRCDGETIVKGRELDEATGELRALENVPCICAAEGLTGDKACKPTMRLNVILPDALDAEGLGVWTVTSSGWQSVSHVKSGLDLLRMFFGRVAGIPLKLSVLEAKALAPDGRAQA
jgi:hypothetical protein